MDVIYSQAQLTIIAAAGDNPNHGLPGVSTRPRRSIRSQEVAGVKLIEIEPYEQRYVMASGWAKRGWVSGTVPMVLYN
jgi:hypothetical protein